MGRRRKARELLVQSLYAARVGGTELAESVQQQIERRNPRPETIEYVESLSELLAERSADFDAKIDAALTGWSPERVGVVERSILQLALAELVLDSGVPESVVLNEALELAKTFGTEDSARFVNGVLERVRRQLRDGADTSA